MTLVLVRNGVKGGFSIQILSKFYVTVGLGRGMRSTERILVLKEFFHSKINFLESGAEARLS